MSFEDFVKKTKTEASAEQTRQERTERMKRDAWSIISKCDDIFEYIPGIEEMCDRSEEQGDRLVIVGDSHRTPFVYLQQKGVEAALLRIRKYCRNWTPDEGCYDHVYTIVLKIDNKMTGYAQAARNDSKDGSYDRPPTIGYPEDLYKNYNIFSEGSEEQDKETIQIFTELCNQLEEKYGPKKKPKKRRDTRKSRRINE